MTTIKATEASNRFGALIDRALAGPVTVEKQGRPVVVVISAEEYARMESELERSEELRLRASIEEMKAGQTRSAEEFFDGLEKKYGGTA